MKEFLKLTEHLYIDLSTGKCFDKEGYMNSHLQIYLTTSQLKLLTHLVNKRELLCSISELEGLFDDELTEFKIPGIKQQIYRIKQKFQNIDPNFDSQTARYVFHSVSGRGYIFHIPFDGRILHRNSPEEYLYQITPELFSYKSTIPLDITYNLFRKFYTMNADHETLLDAVCHNAPFINSDYREILKQITKKLLKTTASTPLVLMGDSGSGISTMTCELAKYMSTENINWNIYYCELSQLQYKGEQTLNDILSYLETNHINKIRKNIILIDGPQTNLDAFAPIYSYFAAHDFENIHFVISGRKSSLLPLFNEEACFSDCFHPHCVYIHANGAEWSNTPPSLCTQFYSFEHYTFPTEVKIHAIKNMINTYLFPETTINEHAENIRQNLHYNDKSINALFLDFMYQYNFKLYIENIAVTYRYFPSVDTEWDEWTSKCQNLNPECPRVKLSELFPYIALLNIANIPVTFDFIQKITGYSYPSTLLRLFYKEYGEIWIENGQLIFHNDNFSMVFFSIHPEFKPYFFISELLTHDYMDLSTLLMFIKNIIWYPLAHLSDSPWIKCVHTLNEFLRQNSEYLSLLQNYTKHSKTGTLYNQWDQEPTPSIDYPLIFDFIFGYCESQ